MRNSASTETLEAIARKNDVTDLLVLPRRFRTPVLFGGICGRGDPGLGFLACTSRSTNAVACRHVVFYTSVPFLQPLRLYRGNSEWLGSFPLLRANSYMV